MCDLAIAPQCASSARTADRLSVLSQQRQLDLPDSFVGKLHQLLDALRHRRCLLVLDNLESILLADGRAGAYRDGYEARVGD